MALSIRTPMFDTTEALCAQTDPEAFFPQGVDLVVITRQAKAVCSNCTLVEQCLDYAMKNNEWGIWGGTTMKERNYIRRHPSRKKAYIDALVRTQGRRDFVPLDDENTIFED
jgi:hypothetical protein